MVTSFKVYTDGSSTVFKDEHGNRTGGIGIFFGDDNKLNYSKGYSGKYVSNQTMELKACIHAIKRVIKQTQDKKNKWEILINTDSMYTINVITKWAPEWILYGWKRKVGNKLEDIANLDIIKELYMLSRIYPITYNHIRSHQKEPSENKTDNWNDWYGNKQADLMAKKEMLKLKK